MRVLQCGEPLAQRAALATMASAAAAVELKFKPHAAAVMPLLQHYMTVRARASPLSSAIKFSHLEVLKRCQRVRSGPNWPEAGGAGACLVLCALECTFDSLAVSLSPRLPAVCSTPVM